MFGKMFEKNTGYFTHYSNTKTPAKKILYTSIP